MKYLKRFWTWLFAPKEERVSEEMQFFIDLQNARLECLAQERIDKDEEYRRMARIFKEVMKKEDV